MARHLLHPRFIGFGNVSRDPHLAGRQTNHEQHMVTNQTLRRPQFNRKEAGCRQQLPVRFEELFSSQLFSPLGRGFQSSRFQDVGDGVPSNLTVEVRQCTPNLGVTPRTILASQLENNGPGFPPRFAVCLAFRCDSNRISER